jgi:hypothetical protein
MDILLNYFNIDPAREYYESISYFEKCYKYDDELVKMVNEATSGVNKQNIVQKFFNFIKKIIDWFIKAIKSLIMKIKTLFVGKKKSADQALADAGIEIPTSSSKDVKSNIVKIISIDSNGVETSVDYEVAAKDLFVKIDNNVNKLIFRWLRDSKYPIADAEFNNMYSGDQIHVHGPAGDKFSYHLFVYFFINKSKMNELINIIEMLVNVKNLNEEEINSIATRMSKLEDGIKTNGVKTTFEIDMKTLQEYNEIYIDLHNKLAKVDITDFPTDKLLLEKFKLICDYLTIIQFGFNRITNAIYHIYDVDARYVGSSKSVDSLSKAVYALIKAGIPHNQIARNAYLIADVKLRISSNINDPARGQSRMVLLPEDESIIYKIALNPLGISDNSKENKIFETLSNNGFSDCFTKPLSITDNKCISTIERALSVDKESDEYFRKERVQLDDNLKVIKNKINLEIHDLHKGNFGYVKKNGKNKLVVIDYGQIFKSTR